MWRHVATDLAADHTVICPDLRGYGASDKPAERPTLREAHHGRDIVAVAQASATSSSPWPATTAAPWSPSAPASTTRTSSRT